MIRRVAILLALPMVLVVLVAIPLGYAWGPHQWLCAVTALGLTAPAGIVTLLLVNRLKNTSPYGQLAGVLVGTFVRVGVGIGGGVLVFFACGPTFRSDPISFWLWLMGAYLATLTTEITLLVSRPA